MPRSRHGTLTANTVASVTITDATPGGIEVVNRSQPFGEIYVTLDGTNPTVAGDDCFLVTGARYFANPLSAGAGGEQVVVKLISSSALTYTVEGNPKWMAG